MYIFGFFENTRVFLLQTYGVFYIEKVRSFFCHDVIRVTRHSGVKSTVFFCHDVIRVTRHSGVKKYGLFLS